MFLIYSLNLENLEIKIWDQTYTIIQVPELLKTIITNFIKTEQGERKALGAFKDDVPDDKITEDGYFIRSSTTKNHEYEIYNRITQIIPGRLWWGMNINISIKKVFKFGIIETSLNSPIEIATGITTKHPEFWSAGNSAKEENNRAALMNELTIKLLERKKKLD